MQHFSKSVDEQVNAKCKLNLIQKSGIPGSICKRMLLFRFLTNETYLFRIQGELFTQWVIEWPIKIEFVIGNLNIYEIQKQTRELVTWSIANHNADKHKSEGNGSCIGRFKYLNDFGLD